MFGKNKQWSELCFILSSPVLTFTLFALQGVFSDLYVVKGAEIGHEIVSVNLFEPGFESVADKIVLTVAEAMSIEPPSPVVVLVGAVVRYTLKVIRDNTPQGFILNYSISTLNNI